jgi:uncharacterized protein YrzB (UPF0473 family)
MNEEEYSFTIINKEGLEVTCDVLSIISDDDSRVYLLYTDYILDDNGNFRVLASELVQDKDQFTLEDIKDEEKLKALLESSKDLYEKTIAEVKE